MSRKLDDDLSRGESYLMVEIDIIKLEVKVAINSKDEAKDTFFIMRALLDYTYTPQSKSRPGMMI